MNTTEAYKKVIQSDIFRIQGPKINLCETLNELVAAIKAEEETNWNLGEGEMVSLDSLIIGAYWSLTEWHGGQESETYATLCSLGSIFSPGCTSIPQEGDSEFDAYELINRHFEAGGK